MGKKELFSWMKERLDRRAENLGRGRTAVPDAGSQADRRVVTLVLAELAEPLVGAECDRLAEPQRSSFLMAYAAMVLWGLRQGLNPVVGTTEATRLVGVARARILRQWPFPEAVFDRVAGYVDQLLPLCFVADFDPQAATPMSEMFAAANLAGLALETPQDLQLERHVVSTIARLSAAGRGFAPAAG